jgi:hypothetical protein
MLKVTGKGANLAARERLDVGRYQKKGWVGLEKVLKADTNKLFCSVIIRKLQQYISYLPYEEKVY